MGTKEKLIASAKEVFSEKGYFKTKVSDIVKKAGVSQGTFYLYFNSKEEIFKELVLQVQREIVKLLSKEYENSLEIYLKKLNRGFIDLLYDNRIITEIFLYQIFPVSEEFKRIYFETVNFARERLSRVIKDAIRKEEIKQVYPQNISNILIGYTQMIFEDYILQQKLPKETVYNLSEEGLNIILKGLKV